MSRKIEKKIRIDRKGGNVFDALITPSFVKKWRGTSQAVIVPDENGVYALTWGDNIDRPDFVSTAKITEFKPHVKLVLDDYQYLAYNETLHFKAKFSVKFEIDCQTDHCILSLTHFGFPHNEDADDFYTKSESGWEKDLESLKKLVENESKSELREEMSS